MKYLKVTICLLMIFSMELSSKNPIIPNRGLNDPHIRIIDGKAYLCASHDKSIENTKFIMEDWWLWSSDDLVNWKLEYVLKPEDTYIGKPFDGCWAPDFVKRNGKYYWYFSERNQQTGVMVADSPSGPWKYPLGKPLLSSDLTPTQEYDMGIIEDKSGDFYIIFGVWDFYIAKLNEDMISLAEKPRKIVINNPRGPYNPDGKNTESPTDDKPFLHLYNGKYYLSWGCFYAMSDNVYGPYDYKGTVVEQESFAPGYESPTWPKGFKQGRHGSFFEWHNQWYFTYCDISQTGNRFFRDSFISYVHYKPNGEMALIRVDGTGVGEYDAEQKRIEYEDYFSAEGFKKIDIGKSFALAPSIGKSFATYPNINKMEGRNEVFVHVACDAPDGVQLQIRSGGIKGKILAKKLIPSTGGLDQFKTFAFQLENTENVTDLCFVLNSGRNNNYRFDYFTFQKPEKL